MAEHPAHAAEIDEAVRKANSHWLKSGLPRAQRRRKAEELTDHLDAAVADGRHVSDVVGNDIVAFASEWAQADRERNWVEAALFLVANLTLWVGLLALLGPLIDGRERSGMPADVALAVELAIVAAFAVWLVRWFRAQLSKQLAVVLYCLITATYLASILVVVRPIGQRDLDLELSPVVVGVLIAVGLAAQGLSIWRKRTDRT
ncbi:MAG: hypothetical protein JJU45_19320 [Acidimicrobiia bacterium]|nr:hypothetical protein [Acidimicrobiia bacterium]